ncbi:hypothetical protein, partial [Archangium sp.]|uniref:hypothetical protein n=1 Tax=Archangium sp. TaxID=1872627 RepID=UPI002ED8C150
MFPDKAMREKAARCAAARVIYIKGIITEKLQPPANVPDIISLSDVGQTVAEELTEEFPESSAAERVFALFLAFSHHELLVDPSATNIDAVELMLHEHLLSGELKLPWVYGRALYDRFFERFAHHTDDHFSHEETLEFLDAPLSRCRSGCLLEGLAGGARDKKTPYSKAGDCAPRLLAFQSLSEWLT